MKKRIFYTEAAYVCGIALIAFAVALANKADFGFSMIAAPAYLLHRWISTYWSVFSFGMAEYCFQALLILIMCLLMRRFRLSFLFSFLTAVFYGIVLDAFILLLGGLPNDLLWQRILYFALNVLFCAAGVAMIFHTYLSPEAYELFVMELSGYYKADIHKFKIGYDLSSFVLSVVMSFAIFGLGNFVGVGWGTVVCALVNGIIISRFSKLYEKLFHFRDALPWRKFFTGQDRVI